MAEIGEIETSVVEEAESNLIPIDESVCGMMFDIQHWSDVFDTDALETNFSDGQTQKITNIDDAETLGITSSFMGGIPYYHISEFYSYIGDDCDLYISFPDLSTSSASFENMLVESDYEIYQIGVWTDAAMFNYQDGEYCFTDLVTKINSQLNAINGSHSVPSPYPSGINVILCGGTWLEDYPTAALDYKILPDCKEKDYPKISILIGQNGTDDVHDMMNNMPYPSQVGLLGKFMACMHNCGAEESIAYVNKNNLNKDDDFDSPELGFGESYSVVEDINVIRKNILINKGYIFPLTYEAKEGQVFFSCDDTMSDGDYNTINLNRTIHKFKRIAKRILVPQVNGHVKLDSMNYLLDSEATALENKLTTAINSFMVNSQGQKQYKAYLINIGVEQDEMVNDKLKLSMEIEPLKPSSRIEFEVE